jgi:outer membrane receptor protein involved in Fe transport
MPVVLSACWTFGQTSSRGNFRLEGSVRDTSGAAIAGAELRLRSDSVQTTQTSSPEGTFAFDGVSSSGTIIVRAPGFQPLEYAWRAEGPVVKLELLLRPASIAEQVTVIAARTPTRVLDTPTSVAILSSEDFLSAGSLALDEKLREIPGFSLFRRSDSRTANPTSQGVSLRGLGASGSGRALVTSDDTPQNDPFGAWVYWGRIPEAVISSVDLSVGGASPLYGSNALGGVIDIIRRPIDRPALTLYSSYGNENTPQVSFFGSENLGPWGGAVDAELFHTDGYVPVPLSLRGTADSFASSEYATGDVTVGRKFGDRGRVFLRGSCFGQSRNNGTVLQNNRATIRELEMGGDWTSGAIGRFSATAYVGREFYNQTFSAISADRNTETLNRLQRVPSQELGMIVQWSRPLGLRQTVVAGVEAHEFRGESDELAMKLVSPGTYVATTAVNSGGRQHNVGIFGEDIIQITSRWSLIPIVRVDHWINFDAFSSIQPLLPVTGTTVRTTLASQDETFISPRVSSLYRLTPRVSLTASANRSFRAPTLNELYRSFRQGNVLTNANNQLLAERLTGGEVGTIVTGFKQRLMLRSTFFWAEVTRPVENVTLSASPTGCLTPGSMVTCTLITRMRENLGRTRSRGVEMEAEAHLTASIMLSGGVQYVDPTVVNFTSTTALQNLEGLQIPQVPRHVFTLQARYFKAHWLLLAAQGRFIGLQYDDDQNAFPLRRYFTMDVMASRPLTSALDVFVAADNLLNQRYDIARTPVLNVGAPILVRVGLRLNLGAR